MPPRPSSARIRLALCLAATVAGLLALSPATSRAEATATVNSPDGVNLRAGPGTSFPIVTAIPFGATVTVTGDPVEVQWLPVLFNGAAGFVMAEYLTIGGAPPVAGAPPPPNPAASPSPTPSASLAPVSLPLAQTAPPAGGGPSIGVWAAVTPPDGLNLRQGPATGFPVLMAVPGGARVQVIGRATADGWYSVVYQNRLGWVDGKYLSFSPPVAAAPPAPGSVPAAASAAAPSRFIWPTESRRISTVFSPSHPGIDIDEYPNGNNPVQAIAAGAVTFAGGEVCCSYGLYVIVRHTDGYTSLYSHLSTISVKEGQAVAQGTVLGKSGNTGFSTGVHVHLEIRRDGVALDPLTLLPGPYVIE